MVMIFDYKELFQAVGKFATIGTYFVASIFIGAIIGIYLDKWFETEPVFFFIFLIFGIIAGFRNIYQVTKKYLNNDSNK